MTRRELLALSILAPLATAETVTYRNNPPYLPYLPLIEKSNVPESHYRLARLYDRLQKPALAARERLVHQRLLAAPKGGMQ